MSTLDLKPQQLDVTVYVRGAWWFSASITDDATGAPKDLAGERVEVLLRDPEDPEGVVATLADGDGLTWDDRAAGRLTVAPTAAQLQATSPYARLVLEVWRTPLAVGAQGWVDAKGSLVRST